MKGQPVRLAQGTESRGNGCRMWPQTQVLGHFSRRRRLIIAVKLSETHVRGCAPLRRRRPSRSHPRTRPQRRPRTTAWRRSRRATQGRPRKSVGLVGRHYRGPQDRADGLPPGAWRKALVVSHVVPEKPKAGPRGDLSFPRGEESAGPPASGHCGGLGDGVGLEPPPCPVPAPVECRLLGRHRGSGRGAGIRGYAWGKNRRKAAALRQDVPASRRGGGAPGGNSISRELDVPRRRAAELAAGAQGRDAGSRAGRPKQCARRRSPPSRALRCRRGMRCVLP